MRNSELIIVQAKRDTI